MTDIPKFRFVCATRASQEEFFQKTALGRSLAVYRYPFVELRLFAGNSQGLPTVYNQAIAESAANPAVMIFVHDDVHICDFFWADRVLEGLRAFELLGLAGNRRRLPRQPAWAFVDDKFTWDAREQLSGVVGHGHAFPPANLSIFGPTGQPVKLLDGLMLWCHSRTLHEKSLRFDESFKFHFYDMDFCRQAEVAGLRMGTWPLSVIHESGGNFNSPSWREGYQHYLAKWGD